MSRSARKSSTDDQQTTDVELVEQSESEDNEAIRYATDIIGEWGPYQAKVVLTLVALCVIGPTQNMGIMFYAPKLDFWCKRPFGFENATKQTCQSYENTSMPCTEFEYDMDGYRSTITNEFNLVCDKAWLISTMKSIYQTGYLISSIFCGLLSDRYGRQRLVKWTIMFEVLFTICQGLSQSTTQFIAARFCLSLVALTRYTSTALLVIEIAGPMYRARVFIISEFAWVLGIMALSGTMFYVRHFREMAFYAAFYEFCFIYLVWRLPESLRWQLTHGQYEGAEKTILACVKVNQHMSEKEAKRRLLKLKKFLDNEQEGRAAEAKKTILDLWKVPILLRRCLTLYVMWFMMTFRIYGFNYNIDDIGGSVFVNMFIQGISQTISLSLTYYFVDNFDRRTVGLISFWGQGVSFVVMIPFLLADARETYITIIVFIMQFFNAASITFDLFSTELFPTTLRQIGMGSCSVVSRAASIPAPFLNELSKATHVSVSMALMAFSAFLNGCLLYLLPETRNKEIPDSIEEAKNFSVKRRTQILTR